MCAVYDAAIMCFLHLETFKNHYILSLTQKLSSALLSMGIWGIRK
ncbi:predicted protein [Plenodomus lingam JN3]|uniref:Predicted protein n=1 Tax=Leptosphaeria maculans (strain JN3 / isolate v23.1.3 / race Av1-4-5-6-7-8) TaxID=985895 RepID=E4ZQF5_LEPMJ|nr:predicted protein [Plenodomus lingam JN3]CBX93630.1 predicted protein [Plenodomus lingam JN3]